MLASFLAASALGLAVPSVLLPNTVWRLQLDVGRHEGVGTWMPSEWAASGERLKIFDVSVEFGDEVCTAEFNERRLNEAWHTGGRVSVARTFARTTQWRRRKRCQGGSPERCMVEGSREGRVSPALLH